MCGNAPDPAKRKQVIEFKLAYSKMAEIAKAQNLPAERRKALEIISNCDDVLAEMDLIEQAENAASLPIILTPSEEMMRIPVNVTASSGYRDRCA
jgi:hypothetical protein